MTETSTKANQSGYFPYIDGLRAVSIIAVVLFHLDARLLPGGFAGVDIFFVVSGFIISASLHDRSFAGPLELFLFFYTRRFRRIVPAMLVMLAATCVAVVVFIPEALLSDPIARTGIAAFYGFSNIRLAFGTNYFFPLAEFNPFTHTWSLAVEEQFYVLFPVLFFVLTNSKTKRLSAFVLAALCIISFGYGFIEPSMSFNLGFYSSPSRFWEIGSGVLLYFTFARNGWFERRPLPELRAATYSGAILIAASFVVGNSEHYPVPGAALPVLGALATIVGLHGRTPISVLSKVLKSRGALWIGLISYSLYLWHWPVFTLFRWTVGFSTLPEKLLALLVAIAMAFTSYVWVEVPLRTSRRLRKPMAAIPVYLVAILLFGWGAARLFAESSHFSLSTVSAHRADWYETPETTLKENEQCRIQNTYDPFEGGSVRVMTRTDCDLPAANSKLIVVGDSHAIAFGSLLKNYALITGIPVTTYAGGCGFIQIYPSQEGCVKFREAVINAIKQTANTGDVIFLPSLRVPRFRYPWDERDLDTEAGWRFLARDVDTGLSEAVSALQRMSVPGLHFVFELPTPIFKIPLFRCSDWFNRTNPACDSGTEISRQLLEQYRQPVVTFASALQKRVEGFSSWDPFPILCPGDPCSMLMNGKPLFFDADHVSGYANAVLLNDFMAKMNEVRLQQRL